MISYNEDSTQLLCASMERARISQVDLAKVASDRSEIERCDHRLKAVNARVAADSSVVGEMQRYIALAAGDVALDQQMLAPPLGMTQVMAIVEAASDAQDSRKARRKAQYRHRRAAKKVAVQEPAAGQHQPVITAQEQTPTSNHSTAQGLVAVPAKEQSGALREPCASTQGQSAAQARENSVLSYLPAQYDEFGSTPNLS